MGFSAKQILLPTNRAAVAYCIRVKPLPSSTDATVEIVMSRCNSLIPFHLWRSGDMRVGADEAHGTMFVAVQRTPHSIRRNHS
jgi:hypothetical protein